MAQAQDTPTQSSELPIAWYESILDHGYLPDFALRAAIRTELEDRIKKLDYQQDLTLAQEKKMAYIQRLRDRPIAEHTDKANDQHYEVPSDFFEKHLGPRLKYSCCLYNDAKDTLAQAEINMLELYMTRAKVEDGMSILDLGCGWGSLCLFLCERYPNAKITALSNSHGQRHSIETAAKERGFTNLTVITGDVKEFDFDKQAQFDRIISIEMFEHMKNYEFLLEKVSRWLKPEGYLFVHIFVHRQQPYDFELSDGWMAKYFFTGGTMPSLDTLAYFQKHLNLKQNWYINGKHYARTADDWLARLDAQKQAVMPYLEECYGSSSLAKVWFNRWRVFYLAVSELFNYRNGQEWGVGHYLFQK